MMPALMSQWGSPPPVGRFSLSASPLQRSVTEVCRGFCDGRSADTATVQGWIQAVVRGGRWRFSDVEAVAQEILLAVLQSARAGKVRDEQSFQKFVYMVAKHHCVNEYHRDRLRAATDSSEPVDAEPVAGGDSPEEALIRARERDLVLYLTQRLPEHCRDLWRLVYREERSAAEVAERLGLSAVNVRVRVHRCLERAREIYREYAAWPAEVPDERT